jgi:hypothetical protein
MTRYTVVWDSAAQDELAEIWMSAANHLAVTAAAHFIDSELSQDALSKGMEITEGLRALLAPPLRVLFTVNEGDRIVEVVLIRRL